MDQYSGRAIRDHLRAPDDTSVRNVVSRARALATAVAARADTYWALASARAATRRRLQQPIRRVLVVCYGNIYRSAFLGAYLASRVEARFEVRSTGLRDGGGRACPARHVAMAAAYGVDLAAHRSSRVTPADLAWADIVVVMDRHNFHALRQLDVAPDKIVWAGALTRGKREIRDPYDMSDQALAGTLARLAEAGERLAALLATTR